MFGLVAFAQSPFAAFEGFSFRRNDMEITPESNCPMDNFNPCRQLKYAWFMKVAGTNPNTGKEIEDWACSMAWIPIMLIENSRQQRGTGAAVESFRNEMVKSNETSQQILIATANVNPNLLIDEKD